MTSRPRFPREERVRVLTLNLWHLPDRREDRLRAAARVINEEKPDVVALQEVARLGSSDSAHVLADLIGFDVAVCDPNLNGDKEGGVAVLTTLPQRASGTIHSLPATGRAAAATAYLEARSGRLLEVTSAHLTHGGGNEAARLNDAAYLNHLLADNVDFDDVLTMRVLAGDFNTAPGSDVHRYLTGKGVHDGSSTLWLDAWDLCGHGGGVTSTADNPWAAVTATTKGIAFPSHLPRRRIDWVLVHGWRYGRPGMPLAARVTATRPVQVDGEPVLPSDHFAVMADIWDPRSL